MLPSLSKLQSFQWVINWWTEVHSCYREQAYSCHCFVCVCLCNLSTVLQVLAGGPDRSNGNDPHEHNIPVLQPQVSVFYCHTVSFCFAKEMLICIENYTTVCLTLTVKHNRITDPSPPICFMLVLWRWRTTLFQSGATTFFSLKTVCELLSSYISHKVEQSLFK